MPQSKLALSPGRLALPALALSGSGLHEQSAYEQLKRRDKSAVSSAGFRTSRQQSRGIKDEGQLGGHVNKSGQERIEKTECCHSDSDAVHNQRSNKVLHDDPVTASSKPQSFD